MESMMTAAAVNVTREML